MPEFYDVLYVCVVVQVFRPDGANWFNVFTEGEAREVQARNRGKKVSPRVRYDITRTHTRAYALTHTFSLFLSHTHTHTLSPSLFHTHTLKAVSQ